MKTIKRLLCLTMAMIMAMSVVACGSKSDKQKVPAITTEELMTKVSEANIEAAGVTAEGTMDISAKLSGMEIALKADYNMKTNVDPMQAEIEMNMDMDAMGQKESVSCVIYEIADGDLMETYTGMNGDWTYQSVDMEEYNVYIEELVELGTSFNIEDYADYFDKMETKASGDNYVLTLSSSTKTILSKLEESEFASYLEGVDTSIIPEAKVTMKCTFDGKTYLPVSTSFSVELPKTTYEGMEIELDKCEMNFKYTSFDAVEITVPEEALAAKS